MVGGAARAISHISSEEKQARMHVQRSNLLKSVEQWWSLLDLWQHRRLKTSFGKRQAMMLQTTMLQTSARIAQRRAALGAAQLQQKRTIFGFFNRKKVKDEPPPSSPVILEQDNLFHKLSESPILAMRQRAERIKSLAPCPVSLNRDGVRRLVNFECPDCGWPTHYSEQEWKEDADHGKYIPRLREANEDEHDLRSGRDFPEFVFPEDQPYEEVINFSSWDIFFYTRNHNSIDYERSKRHVTKLLSFPITIAGVLHKHSPYTRRSGRLTHEGLRSMIALRQILHPVMGDRPSLDVARIFIVGARAESTLPWYMWHQLTYIFPDVPLHIYMIGPEVTIADQRHQLELKSPSIHAGRDRKTDFGVPSKSYRVSPRLTLTTIQATYEEVHAQFEPFDPYTDAFFCFSPGFGFPSQIGQTEIDRARWEAMDEKAMMDSARNTYYARTDAEKKAEQQRRHPTYGGETPSTEPSPPPERLPLSNAEKPQGAYTSVTTAPIVQAQREWARALGQMLSTKCALISTGFSPADVERDILAFESVEGIQGEFEWLINPGENTFASNQWVVADFDPRVTVKANWGIWAVRGKRYDIEGPEAFSSNGIWQQAKDAVAAQEQEELKQKRQQQ